MKQNTLTSATDTLKIQSTGEIPTQSNMDTTSNVIVRVDRHVTSNPLNPLFYDNTISIKEEDESSELYDLANSILEECKNTAPLSDINAAIYLFHEALNQRPTPHPLRPGSVKDLSGALVVRFSLTKQDEDLDHAMVLRAEAVSEWQDIFARERGQFQLDRGECDRMFIVDGNNTEATELSELAKTTLKTFNQSAQLSSLETAVRLHREAILLRPSPHNQRLVSLDSLAAALYARFRHTNDMPCLDEAISVLREAVKTCPESHAYRVDLIENLSALLIARSIETDQLLDLHEAMMRRREVLQATDTYNGEEVGQLYTLATTLSKEFDKSGEITDLEKSILLYRKVLALVPVHHPNRLSVCINLAHGLTTRFDQLGQLKDLDDAISFQQNVLQLQPAPHPDRPTSLSNLAGTLTIRFDQSGQRRDLDDAISLQREALQLFPASHPHQSASLDNLAVALMTQFDQSGQRKDLDEAISFHRDALQLRPALHPERSKSLSNLANALKTRFNQSGQHKNLDEAIIFHREALELRPTRHPERSSSLNNLANVLVIRFNQSGQRKDLNDAISLHRDALKLRPAPHSRRSISMNNLASALNIRFNESGQDRDLDEALSLHRETLELLPTLHPGRPTSLTNLASTLKTQFKQSGRLEDLDKAISFQRDALELLPAPYPQRSEYLYNLANVLVVQFEHSGRYEDLDETINTYQESLDALVSGHPSTCRISASLGTTLMKAYFLTYNSQYLDKSMAAFRVAVMCETASASDRFSAAKSWARHADSRDSRHESALDAYQAAIELLPQLAMLGLDLQSRQQALASGSDGLARDAAACAIGSGQYEKAIELLEEGRTVFWSQALKLRTPTTDLRATAPKLEEKLRHICLALEQGSLRDVASNMSSQKVITMEQETSHFRHLNDEWLATVKEVRQLDGFQDFFRPSQLSTLQGAAANGPVVILNASQSDCAVLILTPKGIQHIPLPDLGFKEVTNLVKLIRCAIAQDGRDALHPESNRACVEGLVQRMPFISDTIQLLRLPLDRHIGRVQDISVHPDNIFRYVLGVLWVSVVEPVMRLLDLEKSDVPPKLWWCLTGPFTFLPIHAAGVYIAERMESVSNYVISSYTPTINSLLSNTLTLSTSPFKMMVVIQPDAPGQKSLPCTIDELQKIEIHVPDKILVRLVHRSVKEVISHLPAMSMAHFACHGQQNTRDPLKSALLLQDGQLKVSDIMQQAMPNALLAFLSACETAMGDESLPDEVIHLGATLLFAGFRGVVATMWSISDADGPKIADAFYENLFKEQKEHSSTMTDAFGPDTTQAAQALHLAVAKLRSENTSFVRWAPFIHLGR